MTRAEVVAFLQSLQPFVASGLFKTLIFLTCVVLGRWLAVRTVQGFAFPTVEERRRALVGIRNLALALALLGVVVIWAQELQTLLISVVAIAAAIVIATKELIMCLSGALLRTTTKAFQIGDRIEINGIRGDVIDHGPLATTLLEIGPGQTSHQATGRAVVLPNAMLLSHPLVNETFTHDFVLHQFMVAIPRDADWKKAETDLLAAARAEVSGWIDEAREFLDREADRYALEPSNVEPRVAMRLADEKRIELIVRIPVPARRKGRTEQAILRGFLERQRAAA